MVSIDHGVGGAIGAFGGSFIAERLAKFDISWYMWMPTITGMICVPFMIATYLVEGGYAALIVSIELGILLNVYLGHSLAMTHTLVGLRVRAVASAILFFSSI